MCGVCGIVGYGDRETVQRMSRVLAHRGPDAEGAKYFPESRVGLGHTRLKIIDLSAAANQPMTQEDESLWVVFNGEIFNHRELRSGLEADGHRFHTRSDTEVILHAYQQWGTDCFARFRGMFAIALFDRNNQQLFLARDVVGVKPLYYHHANGRLTFASEIKAILASGAYTTEVDWQSVHDYFTFLCVPGPATIYRGINQLPPAHWLKLDLRTGDSQLHEYWQLDAASADLNEDEAAEECRRLLQLSVAEQMIADVPVGLFLSGGVDSAVLAGVMSQCSPGPIKTYTVTFETNEESGLDESKAARRIADHFGTDHREVTIGIEKPRGLLDLITYFDQPFANPTSYLMYLISREARGELTVALCGAGGDELFGGYPRHAVLPRASWLRVPPRPAVTAAQALIGLVRHETDSTTSRRLRKFLAGCGESTLARQLVAWTYFFDEHEKSALLVNTAGMLGSSRVLQRHLDAVRMPDSSNRALYAELRTFLPENILEYTDKMSMASSLEVRVPYLDPRLINLGFSLPFATKRNRHGSKLVLRRAFKDTLPPGHDGLPKKGFNAPLSAWMRGGLDRYFDRYMSADEIRSQGIFQGDYVEQLRRIHRTRKRDVSHELFSIIAFDVWYRRYVQGVEIDTTLS